MQPTVSWGASSKLLLTTFLASLIPTLTEWISSGSMPTKETVLSAVLLAALAVIRVVQQLVLDTQVKYEGIAAGQDDVAITEVEPLELDL